LEGKTLEITAQINGKKKEKESDFEITLLQVKY
jgi:hypothetical protein